MPQGSYRSALVAAACLACLAPWPTDAARAQAPAERASEASASAPGGEAEPAGSSEASPDGTGQSAPEPGAGGASEPSADASGEPSGDASPPPEPATPRGAERSYEAGGAARRLPALDTGLPLVDPPPDLGTPRATLYNLIEGCEAGELTRAAHSLDTRRLEGGAAPTELAERLCYLLDRRLEVDWDAVPDHPEGLSEPPAFSTAGPRTARQNLRVGSLPLDGRPVDVRLQRIDPPGRPPLWLVAAPSVARIAALYERHGPPWFASELPDWLRREVGLGYAFWEVLGLPLLALLAFLLVWLPGRAIAYAARRAPSDRLERWVERVRGPLVLFGGALLLRLTVSVWLQLRGKLVGLVEQGTTLAMIVAVGWLVMRVVSLVSELAIRRHSDALDDDQAQEARRVLTQTSVIRRVAIFVVFLVVLGAMLLQLELATAIGSALLGTAGAISVIVAIAAHRVLGNIFTGIQIAITKPVRIGDSVLFEGDWGRVERIHYTHLTIRTWDHRRLIVPFIYFWQNPIENWSGVSSHLVKPIYLHVDFRADVRAIREHFVEACRAAPAWDPEYDPQVIVTELGERSVELRCTCAARDPSAAWDLHCLLREQMLEHLQRQDEDRVWPREREEPRPTRRSNGAEAVSRTERRSA
ncbi:MAG TPA: mechanosensitive ion channel [Sandaracinaceae bacterium LLY-WYZ-13_1]|nr:mechanosensitive ion channel [Sandaracinaceae bacterium LLY-WYZ-13_1]